METAPYNPANKTSHPEVKSLPGLLSFRITPSCRLQHLIHSRKQVCIIKPILLLSVINWLQNLSLHNSPAGSPVPTITAPTSRSPMRSIPSAKIPPITQKSKQRPCIFTLKSFQKILPFFLLHRRTLLQNLHPIRPIQFHVAFQNIIQHSIRREENHIVSGMRTHYRMNIISAIFPYSSGPPLLCTGCSHPGRGSDTSVLWQRVSVHRSHNHRFVRLKLPVIHHRK